MNRPLHLARKDARRLAGGLGAWLVLFPLPAALLVLHATGRVNSFGPEAPDLLGGLHGVLCVAGFLLAVQLALEDPLHDANAGWRTRPITIWDLLLAKLGLACAALVVAPTALLVLVWASAGFTPLHIATLALDQAAMHSLLAGFGLLLGALTRNLGQALLWLTGTLAGLVLAVALLNEGTHMIADNLLASAFGFIALALWSIYRSHSSRLLAGGLGFAGAALAALGVFSSSPIPQGDVARAAPTPPTQPLVSRSEARFGSEHLRLVLMEPDPKNATPTQPVLRLEWRRLAPRRVFLSREPAPSPPTPLVSGPDQLGLTPLSASTRFSHLAGLDFTRHEVRLPAALCENATWRPAAPSTISLSPAP